MKVSIIIPVYNSEEIIDKLIIEIQKILNSTNYEIILVNDFSIDKSWLKIREICKNNINVKGINLNKNYGQHNAIMAGLNFCSGKIIVIMDDDFQHPPVSILKLIDKINEGYELCYTKYINRQHSYYKIVLSELGNIISSIIIDKPFSLYFSSFKCMRSDLKDKLIIIKNPNIYIDAFLLKLTKKTTSININHQKRHSGKTNYSLKKLFILWLNLTLVSSIYPYRISSLLIIFVKLIVSPFMIYRNFSNNINKVQYEIKEKIF
ncbi:MAG: glycosyltransferase [Parcubacteria group bacterium]|jgi:undecaprenyl-phosphate 4-deoxy-4-formamido-L-arabinose transferase|nr:glycosyltransferase [Parcubacteria group bacterium]|tara:strand:- start:1356 stop:2144 length:789 start_codon:yes stop_codon:yes gene_type:complete